LFDQFEPEGETCFGESTGKLTIYQGQLKRKQQRFEARLRRWKEGFERHSIPTQNVVGMRLFF